MKRRNGEWANRRGLPGGVIFVAVLLAAAVAALPAGGKAVKDEAFRRLQELVAKTEKGLEDVSGKVAITIRQGENKREIAGEFAYLKDFGLRVEYHRPEKQIMLLTDEELYIYLPKINQLIHDRPRSGARLYYLDLVRGFSRYFKEGRVKSVRRGERGGPWQVRVAGYDGEEMMVYLRLDDALPVGISASSEQASTDVRFSSLEINKGLKAGELELELPEDVDVVELEGMSY